MSDIQNIDQAIGNSLDLIAAQQPCEPKNVDRSGEFAIAAGYQSRREPQYFSDTDAVRGGVVWQRDVYRTAFRFARNLGLSHVIDIGCGDATKLIEICGKFETIGIDFQSNLDRCRASYPDREWVELDLETDAPDQIPPEVLETSVIVISDVIEHLVDPVPLLRRLKRWLESAPVAILSTPDRSRVPGACLDGPPANPSHTREWTLQELVDYMSSFEFDIMRAGHCRSNSVESDYATTVIAVAGTMSNARNRYPVQPDRVSSASTGYSVGIISNGHDLRQLSQTVQSFWAARTSDMELLVVGDVPNGISHRGVRYIPMTAAARAGRLGEMRKRIAEEARYSTIVFSDDDIEIAPDFIRAIESRQPNFDLLSAAIRNPDGSRYWDWAEHGGPRGHRLMNPEETSSHTYVTGGLSVVRDYVLRNVEWDARRGFYEEEDLDFSCRVTDCGYRIEFCPEAAAIHQDSRYTQEGEAVVQIEGLGRDGKPMEAIGLSRWMQDRKTKTLGVVMIVKNEAENLPELFATIEDVADEVVVVDTGSSDGTLALCKKWGVTLLQDRWQNDFSRARNRSIQAATARHLLWLDADDRIPPETAATLIEMRDGILAQTSDRAYEVTVLNTDSNGGTFSLFNQVRIFPKNPSIRFQNPIHEEIGTSLKKAGVRVERAGLEILHTGYADRDVVADKAQRNAEMLKAAIVREPTNVHYLVHLAQAKAELRDIAEAEKVMTSAIAQLTESGGSSELLAELHVVRAGYRHTLGKALGSRYDLREAGQAWSDWALPHAVLADQHVQNGDWDEAEEAVAAASGRSFHTGVITFPLKRAESNLRLFEGYILNRAGKAAEAIEPLRQCLALDEKNLNGRLALGQILLEQGAFAEAREVLEPAGSDENAIDRFVEVSSAIGLARAMTGDEPGAQACLAPLVSLYSTELGASEDVGPMELAEVLLKAGYGSAAKNMLILFQHTAQAA